MRDKVVRQVLIAVHRNAANTKIYFSIVSAKFWCDDFDADCSRLRHSRKAAALKIVSARRVTMIVVAFANTCMNVDENRQFIVRSLQKATDIY